MHRVYGWMFPYTGIKVGLFLIALAFGYIVRNLAEKQEKELKVLGKAISFFIILTSGAFIIYSILMHLKYRM